MTDIKGIAWTLVEYKGHKISVTVRDGGYQQAKDSADGLFTLIDTLEEEHGTTPFLERNNLHAKMFDGVEEVPFGEDKPVTLEGVTGMDLGLLKYAPKASDLKPGQVFELTANEYKLSDGKLAFYLEGSDYPLHTHTLNEYGTKVMANLFTDKWDKIFSSSQDRQPMPKGDLIIKIECSAKLTKEDNPYRNLVAVRR